jgi:hypothetical protein
LQTWCLSFDPVIKGLLALLTSPAQLGQVQMLMVEIGIKLALVETLGTCRSFAVTNTCFLARTPRHSTLSFCSFPRASDSGAAGKEGKVNESMQLMQEIEVLKAQRAEIEVSNVDSMLLFFAHVCLSCSLPPVDICGRQTLSHMKQ